jgi:hypothetical protein
MKSPALPILVLALVMEMALPPALRADDWKTTDGKVYHDVQVLNSQPDSVTILHQDGGASVPLATLPPDVQAKFHYDPVKAKAWSDAKAKGEAQNRHDLQTEMNTASDMNQAGPLPSSDTPTGPVTAPVAPSGNPHYSMDDMIGSITLRRDLSEPGYHTAAHLVYSVRSSGLGPDRSDPNHHTISEIADSGL